MLFIYNLQYGFKILIFKILYDNVYLYDKNKIVKILLLIYFELEMQKFIYNNSEYIMI